jgi:hypothetical protein
MKFSLRTLMILALVSPPLLAWAWFSIPQVHSGIGQWTTDALQLIGGVTGVVCCVVAYFKSRKPAILVAAIGALVALLGWEVSFLIRLAPQRLLGQSCVGKYPFSLPRDIGNW